MKDVNSTSRFSLLAGAKLFDQPDNIKPQSIKDGLNAVDLILQDKILHDEQEMNKTLSDVIIKQRVFEEVIVERVKLIQSQLHITKQIAKRGGSLVGGVDPSALKKHIFKIKEELKEDMIFQSQQMKEELKDEIAKELAIVLGNEMASEIQ